MADSEANSRTQRRPLGRPPSRPNPRQAILSEAAALFARKGFDGSSLNELAAAMGLSKPAIYNYYPSKQALFDAIILETLTRLHDQTRAAIDPASSAADQLRAFMAAHARCLEENFDAFVATLVGFSGMDLALRQEALVVRDAHEQTLRDIVARGVAEGVFRDVEPGVASRAVLSMLSWMARWFKPGGPKSAEQIAEEYADLLLNGLAIS